MPSSEERMTVLRMVEQGKITPEEGARLLAAMGERSAESPASAGESAGNLRNGRMFRVRVSDAATGRQKVNVNLPLGLVDFGLRFIPANEKFDAQALRDAINEGLTGRIVEVMDNEKGDRVEIYIE